MFWPCVGEGFAGALHWKELIELCKEVGFSGPYLVTSRPIEAELELRKSLGRFIRGGVIAIVSLPPLPHSTPSPCTAIKPVYKAHPYAPFVYSKLLICENVAYEGCKFTFCTATLSCYLL